jgi:acetyl esterase/lipase
MRPPCPRAPAFRRTACLALTLAVVALASDAVPSAAQDGPRGRYVDLVFQSVTRTNGVKYGSAVDKPSGQPVDLFLDVYEPGGDIAVRRAVFVFLFGGGFVAGDREREPRVYCEQMARRGYVGVAIDYRLNQGNIFQDGIPAAVADARQSLRWLRANADRYRLDVDRIVIGGSSAGAITSLFVAYTDVERGPDDGPPDVAAAVDLWGGLYTEVREMAAGEPPLVIIHGTADRLVPFSEAEKLRDRAIETGIPQLFHPLTGQGHAPYMPVELMTVAAPFLFEQLWADAPELSPTLPPPTDLPTATATRPPTETAGPRTATPAPATTTPVPTLAPTAAAPPDAGRAYLPVLSRGG